MSRVAVALLCVLFFVVGSSASAQIFYQPVQYQYFSGGRAYYYGGSDPYVHYCANQLSHEPWYGRSGGYAFHSGTIDVHQEVTTEPVRVFTDMIPGQNARFFGYTIDDAHNAANANAALYFRKADVVKMAHVQEDGTWVVPPQAGSVGTIDIRVVKPAAVVKPVVEPKPILIIPKRLLDKPLWPKDQPTADAR